MGVLKQEQLRKEDDEALFIERQNARSDYRVKIQHMAYDIAKGFAHVLAFRESSTAHKMLGDLMYALEEMAKISNTYTRHGNVVPHPNYVKEKVDNIARIVNGVKNYFDTVVESKGEKYD